jgi:hypothetical protein
LRPRAFVGEGSRSFLKKEPKNFYLLEQADLSTLVNTAMGKRQELFGCFFKKELLPLLVFSQNAATSNQRALPR